MVQATGCVRSSVSAIIDSVEQVLMCTVAAIVAFLGYMPPRGTVITVPRSALSQYSPQKIARAQSCASKHGILWRIEG